MPTSINHREFQESITRELDLIKDRVRNLIAGRHWGEEGRYKEAVLKSVIRRFLPQNISIGTGFVVNSENNHLVSRQLDIILYDNTLPLLFSEGDFIITTEVNVRAIIEVKSRVSVHSLSEIIGHFNEGIEMLPRVLRRGEILPRNGYRPRSFKTFLGIFAYDFDGNTNSQNIDNALAGHRPLINHFSLGTDFFIRKWRKHEGRELVPQVDTDVDFYNLYQLNYLSHSYFISNLIHIVSGGLTDRSSFSFPIEGTKEVHRIRTVYLGG